MCTLHQCGKRFILTLNKKHPRDESILLNPDRIKSIREHLSDVKSKVTQGCVLITTGQDEFFCNGFDHGYASCKAKRSDPAYKNHYFEMIDSFKHVVADLISFPMPTIAAINGCATQAGLMLALSHDFLTMKKGTGSLASDFMAMQMTLPSYFAALIRSKVGSPLACRDLVLQNWAFAETEATEKLLLLENEREVGDDAMEVAKKLADKLPKYQKGEVYGELRKALYPELCKELGLTTTTILP